MGQRLVFGRTLHKSLLYSLGPSFDAVQVAFLFVFESIPRVPEARPDISIHLHCVRPANEAAGHGTQPSSLSLHSFQQQPARLLFQAKTVLLIDRPLHLLLTDNRLDMVKCELSAPLAARRRVRQHLQSSYINQTRVGFLLQYFRFRFGALSLSGNPSHEGSEIKI